MFDVKIYKSRRLELMRRMHGEHGIAIFPGNSESPAQYKDNCYKFRQESNWLYYFGIDEPNFAAVIDLDSGEETIFADDFGIDDIMWMGPMPAVSAQAAAVGVERTAPYAAFDTAVQDARSKGRPVHFLAASREYNALTIASLLDLPVSKVLTRGKTGAEAASVPFTRAVVEMRLVKDADEIRLLDEVNDLGYEMHTIARRGIRLGRVEQEIVGEMEGLALGKAWGVSFPTILTQHGEVFHCHSHALPVEAGRLMVIDAGVESNEHYASDHTRTYPTSGRFTSRQRDMYSIVYDCNELAFSLTRPGISYRDVHLAVSRLMLQRLKDLGLVHGEIDGMVEDGIAGVFMPHGLGHNMGLDVHDMEDLGENYVGYGKMGKRSPHLGISSLRMARELVCGNVITDEPGIYFIPDLFRKWRAENTDQGRLNYDKIEKEYFDFGGIRIEDDVLVTADGARRIGFRRLPASPDEVEEAMKNDRM